MQACSAPTSAPHALVQRSLPAVATALCTAQLASLKGGFALRPFTSTPPLLEQATEKAAERARQRNAGVARQGSGSDQITDQIPHIVRPMGVVEGTSYTVLIIAGLAFAAAVVWAVVNELLLQPREYACFSAALERIRDDPRVTVRLGTPISGYGQESRNRQARQRIPHRTFTDGQGVECTQVQFYARGPSGSARVSAEMYQDDGKRWQFRFLYVDVDSPVPQRVVLIEAARAFAH